MTQKMPASDLVEAIGQRTLSFRKLTVYRLVQFAFLCDWKSAIEYGNPISSNDWAIRDEKVRSPSIEYAIYNHERFDANCCNLVERVTSHKRLRDRAANKPLVKRVLDDMVIGLATYSDFHLERFVISTYPFRYTGDLNLVSLGNNYRRHYTTDYGFEKKGTGT